jgi:hypothetical protein
MVERKTWTLIRDGIFPTALQFMHGMSRTAPFYQLVRYLAQGLRGICRHISLHWTSDIDLAEAFRCRLRRTLPLTFSATTIHVFEVLHATQVDFTSDSCIGVRVSAEQCAFRRSRHFLEVFTIFVALAFVLDGNKCGVMAEAAANLSGARRRMEARIHLRAENAKATARRN